MNRALTTNKERAIDDFIFLGRNGLAKGGNAQKPPFYRESAFHEVARANGAKI